jgi:hypothetical protein
MGAGVRSPASTRSTASTSDHTDRSVVLSVDQHRYGHGERLYRASTFPFVFHLHMRVSAAERQLYQEPLLPACPEVTSSMHRTSLCIGCSTHRSSAELGPKLMQRRYGKAHSTAGGVRHNAWHGPGAPRLTFTEQQRVFLVSHTMSTRGTMHPALCRQLSSWDTRPLGGTGTLRRALQLQQIREEQSGHVRKGMGAADRMDP